ncbi:hypothetical protein B566_EDAN007080, partial [Ephemera danica]
MSRCRIVLSSGAFVRDLHVSGVAEVDARLVGTLVAAVLQRDDTLTRSHLLLAELSHVLVSLLGSNAGQTVVASLRKYSRNESRNKQASLCSPMLVLSENANDDGVEVLSLPQVDGLEGFLRGHAQLARHVQERVDVLHALEGHGALVDFLDAARLHLVHHP